MLYQLFKSQEHPDVPLLEHAKELAAKLTELGITSSPNDEEQEEEIWEDDDDSDEDEEDVEMK